MLLKCNCCGKEFPEELIDYKPQSLAGFSATAELLSDAADRGEDFDFPACKECFSPAFANADKV